MYKLVNIKKKFLFACSITLLFGLAAQAQPFPFQNAHLGTEERIKDLLARLSPEEKTSLLGYNSKPIQRLGIPAYNWWNEALHGVARAGRATVFPQSIGMAASFNTTLMQEVATTISTEARAKFNLAIKNNSRQQYQGLTFWSPNVNLFRDPRWGRGQETYGEDPFLTAQMGLAFVKGIQGNDNSHLKAAACAKHFAVHSGPESLRHGFDAVADEKDMRETYLYAFEKLAKGGVASVMCAYNRVNGEPCCTGETLLKKTLRNEWGFSGYVVTDCWALQDIYTAHKTLPNSVEVAAAAIKAGVNVDCSNLLQDDVLKAIDQGLLTKVELDTALAPALRTLLKLGLFDKNKKGPYDGYGADSISNPYHTALARSMASQSMVLLKNVVLKGKEKPLLPLEKSGYKALMVLGPNAASIDALLGNYHGVSAKAVNYVEGITSAVDAGTRVEYDMGCDYTDSTRFGGIWAASNADISIAVIGFSPVYEGEEGDAFLAAGKGDRANMQLPAPHIAFIRKLRSGTKTPLVVVVTGGSAVDISSIEPYADAIIYAWYAGEQGGNALADILFGNTSPSGRLPLTFYNSISDLPNYNSYAMAGRTYRYFDKPVMYPFGFGLSYTTFNYQWASSPQASHEPNDTVSLQVKITNTGQYDAAEVVQAYISYPAINRMPLKELQACRRIDIKKGKTSTITLQIPVSELKKWDLNEKKWKLYSGNYTVTVGGNSMDHKLEHTFTIR